VEDDLRGSKGTDEIGLRQGHLFYDALLCVNWKLLSNRGIPFFFIIHVLSIISSCYNVKLYENHHNHSSINMNFIGLVT